MQKQALKQTEMQIFRLKVEPSGYKDVYRIIDLKGNQALEQLHRFILKSFKFKEGEMASFYLNYDDQENRMEICLSEMQQDETCQMMDSVRVRDVFGDKGQKLTYVYDFLNMWRFDISFIKKTDPIEGVTYPYLYRTVGKAPDQQSKQMGGELNEDDVKLIGELLNKNKDMFDDDLDKDGDDFDDGDGDSPLY